MIRNGFLQAIPSVAYTQRSLLLYEKARPKTGGKREKKTRCE